MRLLCGYFLLLLPFYGLAQSKTDRLILATEQQRFASMVSRDTVALRPLLADDLVYIHSNALQENKAAHLSAITTGRLVYASMLRETAQVRRYGKMALTNGIVQVKGVVNGTPFDIRLLYTGVYRRVQGKWRLVNWQSTRLP